MKLPDSIERLTAGEGFCKDRIGMSGSSVLIGTQTVLKIRENSRQADRELEMLRWLRGKLPVPAVLAHEVWEGRSYLLMEKCPGEMACAPRYMGDPRTQIPLLAEALKQLWAVDITGCPRRRLADQLRDAAYRVEQGLVDVEDAQPETFGAGGFRDPTALLGWLYAHQPQEEPVLSHGDFCLPNIFFHQGRVSGYIDLGRCSVGDKWCDIALCCRSLLNNYGGKYGRAAYDAPDLAELFRALGFAPDEEKLRYYILLDELF